jgi:hypothetical protein
MGPSGRVFFSPKRRGGDHSFARTPIWRASSTDFANGKTEAALVAMAKAN